MEEMDLCRPCACEIERDGKQRLRPVRSSINNKVTCAKCQRRRYGMTYELVSEKERSI